ncbi:hypothetical protein SAMN05444972_101499 [Marininema halotolerans]|uniref:Uncharacterized protein n=1 Tax=Marininema halotolerans TaxID=1155944 RepID=A0A1I6PC73_9BACL|nr:hypothetical protein SAMN05444972_101499 [Marininema halotolerans]
MNNFRLSIWGYGSFLFSIMVLSLYLMNIIAEMGNFFGTSLMIFSIVNGFLFSGYSISKNKQLSPSILTLLINIFLFIMLALGFLITSM